MADLAEIQAMIEAALPGAEVEVTDQTGTGDHLEATVTAPQFEGLSRIDQHRLVKAAVQRAHRRRRDPRPHPEDTDASAGQLRSRPWPRTISRSRSSG